MADKSSRASRGVISNILGIETRAARRTAHTLPEMAAEFKETIQEIIAVEDDFNRTMAAIHATVALAMHAMSSSDASELELSIQTALIDVQAKFGAMRDRIAMGAVQR